MSIIRTLFIAVAIVLVVAAILFSICICYSLPKRRRVSISSREDVDVNDAMRQAFENEPMRAYDDGLIDAIPLPSLAITRQQRMRSTGSPLTGETPNDEAALFASWLERVGTNWYAPTRLDAGSAIRRIHYGAAPATSGTQDPDGTTVHPALAHTLLQEMRRYPPSLSSWESALDRSSTVSDSSTVLYQH